MNKANEMLEFSQSMDCSSSSLQTMIINKNYDPSDSDFSLLISNQIRNNENILEASNSAYNDKCINQPQRHISALNYIENDQKSVYELSGSLITSSNLKSNVKDEGKHEIPFDSCIKSNVIKIMQSNWISDSSNDSKWSRMAVK